MKAEQKQSIQERKQRDKETAERQAEAERVQAELAEIEQRLYAYHVQSRAMPEDEWSRRKAELVRDEYNPRLDEREQRTLSSLRRRIGRTL